jgi:glutamate synthase domain-containing protein 2
MLVNFSPDTYAKLIVREDGRVDGGFRSCQYVLMASVMGVDEYGFGSVAMNSYWMCSRCPH